MRQTAISALPPGSTVGILGGGQLGRMLAQAAAGLGLRCHIYSDRHDSPAAEVAASSTTGAYDDIASLKAFAANVDVVTYEFENVPVAAARHIAADTPVRPRPRALEVAQDRLAEKQFLESIGVAVAPFAKVSDPGELAEAVKKTGLPAILKTRRLGYDGKGQVRLADRADMAQAMDGIGHQDAVLEKMVAFSREVSIIAVRGNSSDGNLTEVFYDCPENTHRDGILHRSIVPAPLPPADARLAREIAGRILTALDYIGVLAVEFFHFDNPTAEGSLLVNEIAPRVHNSGHWTMDACGVDQFENHIRAVAGWPLGPATRHSNAEMTNLIGPEIGDWLELLRHEPDALLHVYGKGEARPGRKMGHLNRLTPLQGPTD